MISLKGHMKLKDTKAPVMAGPSSEVEVLEVVNNKAGTRERAVVLQEVDYDQYPDDAQPIHCNYRDTPRPVHPSSCLWHRAEKDPECFRLECPRVNL